LPKEVILARLKRVRAGDIIIAHLNRPESDTAEALAVGLRALLQKGYRFVKLSETAVRKAAPRRTAP
jgi:tRNA G37 N-methylase Trm5